MKTYLITSSSLQAIKDQTNNLLNPFKLKVELSHPDILTLKPNPSIGISQIRSLQVFLARKPYQAAVKVGLLLEANNLTLAAQNAFLKTLEEPPENSLIILGTRQKSDLLETVVSRCQVINLSSLNNSVDKETYDKYKQLLTSLYKNKLGERIKTIEPFTKNKDIALDFCQKIIAVNQKLLHQEDSGLKKERLVWSLKQWQQANNLLEQNINPKLCLNNAVIDLF